MAKKSLKPLNVLLFGGCVVDYLKDHLKVAGLRAGLEIATNVRWVGLNPGELRNTVNEVKPDVVVLQPALALVLAPLWSNFTLISSDERRKRLDALKGQLTQSINALAEVSQGRLILIHNVAPLQQSPFGRGGFRIELNFREVLSELNIHIERLIRNNQNMMLVDEAQLGSRVGLRKLFDDNYYPNRHHGGQFDVKVEHSTQHPIMSEVFANEYLALYKVWTGENKIKCIVCDLDNTLWPGIAAETGFSWMEKDITSRWLCEGVHEALRIMKSRGVLLATSSKNTEEVTLKAWKEAADRFLGLSILSPDDFVLHKISWSRKSQAIAEVAQSIGIGLDSILFIDDNPVEREEVRQSLPQVQIFDGDMVNLREFLISHPGLDVNSWTQEAGQRTEMTRAQLQREEARKSTVGEEEFLKSLNIQMNIEKVVDDSHMDRIIELVQRTNQFNTTQKRYDAATIVAMISDPEMAMYTFSVSDKFTAYGTVGFVLLKSGSVELFVMSCRVLGLNVAVPFLVSCLKHSGQINQKPRGINISPRNEPCRDLFTKAGFKKKSDNLFELEEEQDLAKVDSDIYHIRFNKDQSVKSSAA